MFIFRHERQQRHERQGRKKRKRKSDDDCFDLGYDIPISPEKNLTKHLTRRYARVSQKRGSLVCLSNHEVLKANVEQLIYIYLTQNNTAHYILHQVQPLYV